MTQGIGIINKHLCQNNEDFYTFENINEINNDYFFHMKKMDLSTFLI